MSTDETLTPPCVICGEPLATKEWSERLRVHQPFTEWRKAVTEQGAGAALLPVCVPCKSDPNRAERFLNELGREGLRQRLEAVVQRHEEAEQG